MLVAWAWSLFRLYRDIKHSEKLLPDKKIFILHGSLLIAFLLTLLTQTIILEIADTQTSGSNAQLVLYGTYNLLGLIYNCIEMATFYLVVHLMMAVTQTARTKYIALQKFLLNGFLKPEELEKAVRAQNPEMPQEAQDNLHDDCQHLNNMLGDSSRSILSGMVEVANANDYAYMGFANKWKYDFAQEAEDVPLISTYEN